MKEISKKLIQLKGLKIKKNGKNQHQKFDYYLLSDILENVNDVCKIINLFYYPSFSIDSENNTMITNLHFYDLESGEEFQTSCEGLLDNQQRNPVQAGGSSLTYNLRYTLMYFLGISDNVDDPDSNDLNAPKIKKDLITEKQRQLFIEKHIHLSNEEKKALFAGIGLNKLDEMTQTQFKELMK
jgi:hypothetical protein